MSILVGKKIFLVLVVVLLFFGFSLGETQAQGYDGVRASDHLNNIAQHG